MEDYKVWAEGVLQKVREKMDWCSEKNRDKIPYTTDGLGNYDDRSDETKEWSIDNGINWWTNGFWGGIMWLLYQDTKKEKYADIARISEQKLAKCFEIYYGLHHDVGFMFLPTAVADYRLTGNKEAKRLAMHGANLLAGRFNPAGNFIRAWNQTGNDDTRGWAIIDCMFNISLLYWASEESGDPRFRHIAMRHADTTLNNFIRPDGSVRVIVKAGEGRVLLSVADTGIGIPPKYQGRVFERFFRVDKSRSKASGGTGLGLSIVKHGAQYHGAKISLRSQPDRGTEISVLFPAKS